MTRIPKDLGLYPGFPVQGSKSKEDFEEEIHRYWKAFLNRKRNERVQKRKCDGSVQKKGPAPKRSDNRETSQGGKNFKRPQRSTAPKGQTTKGPSPKGQTAKGPVHTGHKRGPQTRKGDPDGKAARRGKPLMRWRRLRAYRAITLYMSWGRRDLKPPSQDSSLPTSLHT